MKTVLIAMLFAASAFAKAQSGAFAAACGPGDVNFSVKLDDSRHTLAQLEQGKAQVVFIQDAGTPMTLGLYPTTKLGIDGAWAGANKNSSYFAVSVEPGEHHVCADLQSALAGHAVELAHFTAEAGKVYYFRTRLVMTRSLEYLELNAADGDEGQYLVAAYPLSTSRPKK